VSSAFEIAVAAFRTAERADEVADDIADTGMPVATRFDNNWHRVIVGPYPTQAEADKARTALLQQGFTDIRVTPTTIAP
jgi:cell division protein FtsN